MTVLTGNQFQRRMDQPQGEKAWGCLQVTQSDQKLQPLAGQDTFVSKIWQPPWPPRIFTPINFQETPSAHPGRSLLLPVLGAKQDQTPWLRPFKTS